MMNSKSFLAITGLVVILLATGTYMAMAGTSGQNVATTADVTTTTPSREEKGKVDTIVAQTSTARVVAQTHATKATTTAHTTSRLAPKIPVSAQTGLVKTSSATTVSPTTSNPVAAQTHIVLAPPATSLYKDGTYIATGTYNTPEGGTETIKVSITLSDDIIIDSSVTANTSNASESERYQKQFIAGYKLFVTGKKITDVKLSAVSGSSLTSSGWNSAVASIEAQAKV